MLDETSNNSPRKINPSQIVIKKRGSDEPPTLCGAAVKWYRAGFTILPIVPHTKKPALKWDPWLDGLSVEKIQRHWTANPDHEIGAIIGDEMIAFDADTPEAISALKTIEQSHGILPNMVVKTRRGEHHYFRRAETTIAKLDGHNSAEHPERIDIKTGRGYTILPPSTGKELTIGEAKDVSELVAVDQAFINSVYLMNGRPTPDSVREPSERRPRLNQEPTDKTYEGLKALLDHIEPDCGYGDWLNVLMAVFTETSGSDDGLALVDSWSSKGSKYKSPQEIDAKWSSFRLDVENPITIATLHKMVEERGHDVIEILDKLEPQFEVIEKEVDDEMPAESCNPLDKFSLRGQSEALAKEVSEEKFVLDPIALSGQMTIIYAAPNSGKTLVTIKRLCEAIKQKRIDPNKTYYLNMDDTSKGLLEKLTIAEEHGFHMLAEGYHEFKAAEFLETVGQMAEKDQVRDVIIVLDTLKKVTNLMDKRISSSATKVLRKFVQKGGTAIGLAHTNKRKGDDQQSIYGGTSDFVDDSDCVYIIDTKDSGAVEKTVVFRNEKKRGNVPEFAHFSYSNRRGITYNELFSSVRYLDEDKLEEIEHVKQRELDEDAINIVKECISSGTITKTALVAELNENTKLSKNAAKCLIEKYTGDDPEEHLWNYERKGRGRQEFYLLSGTVS